MDGGVNVIRPILREISLLGNHYNGVVQSVREETIRVKVHRQGMEPILFMMNKSSSMNRLMRLFSTEAKIGLAGLRFLFDGKRIQDYDTPASLELEHDDLIEVLQYQFGGCYIKY